MNDYLVEWEKFNGRWSVTRYTRKSVNGPVKNKVYQDCSCLFVNVDAPNLIDGLREGKRQIENDPKFKRG